MTARFGLCVGLLFFLPAGAQEESPAVRHRTYAGVAAPNVELPAHVVAEAGKLTLFADFGHPKEEGIPLYLVNRTVEVVNLDGQDGDIYIKLEHQLADGTWVRAQSHQYSGCGNSYVPRVLNPGMHFAMHGYQPAQGERAKIRYSGYGSMEMMSNVGEGLVRPEDVHAAAMDRMSLRGVPQIFERTFDVENRPLREIEKTSTRVAALRAMTHLGEVPLLRAGAEVWAKQLETAANPTPEERQALPLVREILARDWGPRAERMEPLLKACLTALKANREGPFGSLAQEPALAWRIIGGTHEVHLTPIGEKRQRPTDMALWREILELAVKAARTAEGTDVYPILTVLGSAALVDELLPDAAVETLLDKEGFTTAAANALSRRGRWERLAELGAKLQPEQQIAVLAALGAVPATEAVSRFSGYGQPRQPPHEGPELAFWRRVVRNQPAAAGAALYRNLGYVNRQNPYLGEVFEPIRTYWRHQAERAAAGAEEFEWPRQASQHDRASLEFIVSWKSKKDIPLLLSLLRHGGYEARPGARYDKTTNQTHLFQVHHFPIRNIAADALKALGEALPADAVLEKEVP